MRTSATKFKPIFCAIALAFMTGQAVAKERIALGSFEVAGARYQANADSYRRAFLAGLQRVFDVVSDDEAAQAAAGRPGLQCESTTCARNLGEALHVNRVAMGKLTDLGPNAFRVEIALIGVSDGKVWGTNKEECQPCTSQEARQYLEDGALAMKVEVDAADKRFALENATRAPEPNTASAQTVTARPRGSRPLRIAAIASWSVGAALLGTGIGLLAIDGKVRDYSPDSTGAYLVGRWDTVGAGATLLTIGAALEVGGGLLWWRDQVRHRQPAASPAAFAATLAHIGQ